MTATIKAIDHDSVHRLHAGQVVLELQGAIKELVENALDAGATSIDVRIKDHGLDSIEVVDNGSGIAEADWPYIGMKHHTSKLPSLSELASITTFGFRGEALGSLCALCESVQVVTATKETAPMGAVIKLGRDGKVADSSGKIARPRGTTITLTGLFIPLPVRRKEFERTAKREFTKALTMLYAYALVPSSVSVKERRTGVRLKVESLGAGKGGKRSVLLTTDGRGSLRASVTSVWGPKALEGVLDVDLELAVEVDSIAARREGIGASSQTVRIGGLISSAAWGQGRSSPDRQFYYINGRPCDLKQVGKTVNEVYKSFNTNQVPLVILDFQVPPDSVDINVSPDKRTIFLHSEANLIVALRTALEEFFTPSRSSYPVAGASQVVKVIQHTQTQLQIPSSDPTVDTVDNANGVEAQEEGDGEAEVSGEVSGSDSSSTNGPSGSCSLSRYHAGAEAIEADNPPGTAQRPRRQQASDIGMQFEGEIESADPAPTVSRPSRRRIPSPAFPPSPPLPRRPIRTTIDTTTATWSPDHKSKSSRASQGQATKGTGRDVRESLRKKLAGFASQRDPKVADSGGVSEDEDELMPDDDDVGDEETEVLAEEGGDGEELHDLDSGTPDNLDVGSEADEQEPNVRGRDPAGPVFEDALEVDELEKTPMESDAEGETQVTNHKTPSKSARRQREVSGSTEIETPVVKNRESSSSAPPSQNASYRDEISSSIASGEVSLRFDSTRLQSRYAARFRQRGGIAPRSISDERDAYAALAEGGVAKAAGISNRDFAQAEEALSRVISKPDFERMEVLGQFNKGFIIARLRSEYKNEKGKGKARQSDDLFIIDQHASDEKFNFETLQRTTVIKAQSLIKPRPLQLTAGDEIVAMENLDVLKANGFEVKVDEDRAPGRGERISLAAMPVSKETTFDFKDLEQLLHLLSDGARPAGQMVRCSKARSMFAMRACRKSVMIGKSLTKHQMVQLLRNMGTIDQPWNCPHGRPTMRHLTKIEASKRSRNGRDRIDWSRWDAKLGIEER